MEFWKGDLQSKIVHQVRTKRFSQCVYFDVFTSYARHKLPENIDEILVIVESVTTNVTSQHSGSINHMSQLNSEVSSWNTKRQIFPSSSLIFNESIGEDGLSSQSTYDVRFDNPPHIVHFSKSKSIARLTTKK